MRLAVLALMALVVCPGMALADVMPFSMPSRNVDCTVGLGEGPSDISCTIFERGGDYARPAPAGCGAWGHHYMMRERGPVEMLCGPPGPKNSASYVDIAQYGVTGRFGGITCLSQESGLECTNLDGHGFKLSRRVQRVY